LPGIWKPRALEPYLPPGDQPAVVRACDRDVRELL